MGILESLPFVLNGSIVTYVFLLIFSFGLLFKFVRWS